MFNIKFILFTALFLRILAVIFFGDRKFDYEFDVLVKNIINGNGYSYWSIDSLGVLSNTFNNNASIYLPSGYMPIFYPLFLSFFAFFLGVSQNSVVAILFIQSIIGTLNCYIIYRIYMVKYGSREPLLVWFCALFPLHIFMSSQISASNVYVFLMSLVILYYYKFLINQSWKNLVILSISLPLLALSRADAILIIPAIIFMLFFFHKGVSRQKILSIVLISTLILTPMSLRSFDKFGFYYPHTISGGLNLWLGNNSDATGSRMNYVVPYKPFPENILKQIDNLKITDNYEVDLDNIYKEAAKEFMTENPLQVIQLSIKKIIFFWVHIYDSRINYPGLNNPLYWAPWIILFPFFILSTMSAISRWRDNDLEIFLIFYFSAVYSVFFVLPRYRLIVFPIYFLFSFYYLKTNRIIK